MVEGVFVTLDISIEIGMENSTSRQAGDHPRTSVDMGKAIFFSKTDNQTALILFSRLKKLKGNCSRSCLHPGICLAGSFVFYTYFCPCLASSLLHKNVVESTTPLFQV